MPESVSVSWAGWRECRRRLSPPPRRPSGTSRSRPSTSCLSPTARATPRSAATRRTFDLPPRAYSVPVTAAQRQVLRVSAYGVVTDSAGQILLVRQTELTAGPGWWTLPGVYRARAQDQAGTTDSARWVPMDEFGTLDVADLVRVGIEMAAAA